MKGRKTGMVVWTAAVACLFLVPAGARAEVDFGIRGGLYSDALLSDDTEAVLAVGIRFH